MKTILKNKFYWFILLGLLFIINYIASFLNLKIDFTEDKRYTLSVSSKKLLTQLNDNLYIDILMDDNVPSEFKKLKNTIESFLDAYNEYADNKINFRFINPNSIHKNDSANLSFNDTLNFLGLRPLSINKKIDHGTGTQKTTIYPAAILRYKNKISGINFLSENLINNVASLNNAEALLEYKFSHSIERLIQTKMPSIVYLTGHGEPLGYEVYDLFNTIVQDYKLDTVNLSSTQFIANEKYDLLLLVNPIKQFNEVDKIKIEQFILNGGKAFFAIENVFCRTQDLIEKKQVFAQNLNLDIQDLLFQYGVKINFNLLQDLQCDRLPMQVGWVDNQPQFELMPWFYAPLLSPNNQHPITKNIDNVLGNFSSTLEFSKNEEIKKTPLLFSSTQSKTIGTPTLVSFDILKQNIPLTYFNQSNLLIGSLSEGNFKSIYGNRITADLKNMYEQKSNTPFLNQSIKTTKIITVSDADILTNAVTQKNGPLKMGTNPYTNFQFGNNIFVSNALEYLLSESGIIENRNKNFTLRLLDKKKIENEKTYWQWFNLITPIAIIILAYFVYYIWRWRRYTFGK